MEFKSEDIKRLAKAIGAWPGYKVELYWAVNEGTELLENDANFEVEFIGEFESDSDAIESIQWRGRGFLSSPERGKYTHRILSTASGIELTEI